MVQKPYKAAGIALCVVGLPGIGKTILFQLFLLLTGQNLGFSTSKADLCVGRFNTALTALLGILEEMNFANVKDGKDGSYKEMITNKNLMVETDMKRASVPPPATS